MRFLTTKIILLLICNFPLIGLLHAQTCVPGIVTGPNLVTNGGFESGDVWPTHFYTDVSCSWNNTSTCSCHGDWSNAGEYYIGYTPNEASGCSGKKFQSAWGNTPHSGTKFMMVDGKGGAFDPVVWKQSVTVENNSYYYFELYITTLGNPSTKAQLKFNINGVDQGVLIQAPSSGTWQKYSQLWLSTVSGSIDIKVIDIQGDNSGPDKDDFGLDDIVFRKGCPDETYTTQPELGPDLTFCGTSATSFTLNPGVSPAFGQTITWSTGTADAGKTTIDVSAAGKYYVCVSQTGSCTKIDSVTVTDRFSIDLGNDVTLCDPSSVTLNAGFSGPGVTYQWYKDGSIMPLGTNKTVFVNTSGKYKVVVNDPKCQMEKDSINVTLKSGFPTANNVDFCIKNNPDTTIKFSVTGTGSYDWYNVSSGGSVLAGGSNTLSYSESGITLGDTLYVQDNAITTSTTGSTNYTATDINNGYDKALKFSISSDITINSLQIPFKTWYSPSGGYSGFTITLEVVDADGNSFSPAKTFTSSTSLETVPGNDANNVRLYTFPFSGFNILSSWGTTLRLKLKSATHGNGSAMFHNSGYTYPISSGPVTLLSSYNGDSWNNGGLDSDGYSYFFNWNVSSKTACKRVPVMARNICVLSVEDLRLNAYKNGANVYLNWRASEVKNDTYFEIQRFDGTSFNTIAIINADSPFRYVDENVEAGMLYYRIKQVDKNAEIYSDVITVSSSTALGILLYPNPTFSSSNLLLKGSIENDYKVTIFDAYGTQIMSFNGTANSEISIGENFAPGLYLVSVNDGYETKTVKLIKK